MFALQNAPAGRLELPGLALGRRTSGSGARRRRRPRSSTSRWRSGRTAGGSPAAWTYATALFERETVERWLGYLRRVLEGMVADDAGARSAGWSCSPRRSARRLLRWSGTRPRAELPARRGASALFAQARRRARRTRWRSAWDGERLTYARAGRPRQPARAPPAPRRRGRRDARGRVPGARTGDGRRHRWRCSRPAARTCRSTRRIPRSGWPSCSPTPASRVLVDASRRWRTALPPHAARGRPGGRGRGGDRGGAGGRAGARGRPGSGWRT